MLKYVVLALLAAAPAMAEQPQMPPNVQRASIIALLAGELAQAEMQVQELQKQIEALKAKAEPAPSSK